MADVPVGVLLSGGLDSSLIVALLAEAGQHDLATFSVGFESEAGEEGDEFAYSDQVSRLFDTDHHQLMVPSDRVSTALGGAIAAMSEPMMSHDVVAFHLLSELVSKEISVVQTGQGADEVFAGYHWYPRWRTSTGRRSPGGTRKPTSTARTPTSRRSCNRTCCPTTTRPPSSSTGTWPRRVPRPRWTRHSGSTPTSCWWTTRSSGSTT